MYCANKRCSYSGSEPYHIRIPIEAIMDENNVATSYCPYCHDQMVSETNAEIGNSNLAHSKPA